MDRPTALVVGGLGVTGRNLVQHLTGSGRWTVFALSRRAPDFPTDATFIPVDLLDRPDCEAKLRGLTGVTHVFYAAYQERPTQAELAAANTAMLVNVVEVVEAAAPALRRVVLVQGGKVYGVHLGPYKTPAKESDARHMPPNFYYDQEDFLRGRQRGKGWAWAAVRPSGVCGFAVGNPMNISTVIAVYAAVCKELGLPLRFPGTPGAYRAVMEVTDAALLARAMEWAATDDRCRNEAFNVTNGDFIRWENVWPKFAAFFGMNYAPPQTISLSQTMADKGPLWDRMVEKYGLRPHKFDEIAAWPFGDGTFRLDYDVMSDMNKARRCGFHDVEDSEEMFLRLFAEFRNEKVVP